MEERVTIDIVIAKNDHGLLDEIFWLIQSGWKKFKRLSFGRGSKAYKCTERTQRKTQWFCWDLFLGFRSMWSSVFYQYMIKSARKINNIFFFKDRETPNWDKF